MERTNEEDDLLLLISEDTNWDSVQDFRRAYDSDLPLYLLRRKPSRLSEIDWEKYGEFGIWYN
jgi:hypothetical protein